MPQVETIPQSMADIRTIVLKPRLDQSDIRLIVEKIKPSLFPRFGFKSKSTDVRLLDSEICLEPYLIIAGRYVLDYCRKHLFEVNVEETTTKIYVAGQEFVSEKSDPKVTKKVVKMTGEEHAHHERQAYYILDRMKREIPPERLPISPFEIQRDFQPGSNCRTFNIPDETQIEFLKEKIAQRPKDLAEIIREIFEITDRTIAYYPIYQLTFENEKTRKDAVVTINGITGETILNGTKKLAVKTIVGPDQGLGTRSAQTIVHETAQTRPVLSINPPETTNTRKERETLQPIQPDTEETHSYEDLQTEPIFDINPPEKTNIQQEQESTRSTQVETDEVLYEQARTKPALNINPPETEKVPKEEPIQPTQVETEDMPYEETQTEPTPNINPPETIDIQKEQETMILGFPAIIHGKILASDDKVEVIIGDVEIPSGTNIDKTLVVKGTLKMGSNCKVHGKLKVLKDITVGADTIVDGDIVSGGNIYVGPRSLIAGSVKAAGVFEIEEDAIVEGIFARNTQ